MYAVKTCWVRKLTKRNYLKLKMLCLFSNNLYNSALYNVRQQYFQNKTYLSYYTNCSLIKDNENYKLLHANIAQQTIKQVDGAMKAFFALLRKVKRKEYDWRKVAVPNYRNKGDKFGLTLPSNKVRIRNGFVEIPTSKKFKEIFGKESILIPVTDNFSKKDLAEIKIIPIYNGRFFKLQFTYKQEVVIKNLNEDNVLAIDIGIDNLTACISTVGTSFLMDGRKLKSINQGWNKRKAYLQSILTRQRKKTSAQIQRITRKRNNRCDDYLKKTARYIINHCLMNNIGSVVLGYNPDLKQAVTLGRTNQTFVQIAFGKLKQRLGNLCALYKISYEEHEESYTSKASCLDLDSIPVFGQVKKPTFSGRRIKRGLYQSKDGKIINADINGAANILRKSKQNLSFYQLQELCRGVLVSPVRIRQAHL